MISLLTKTILFTCVTVAVVEVRPADSASLGEVLNGARDNMSQWIEREILRKSPIVVLFSETMDKIKRRFDEAKSSSEMVGKSDHELSILYFRLVIDELHKLHQELVAKDPSLEEKKDHENNLNFDAAKHVLAEVVHHELEHLVVDILRHFASGPGAEGGVVATAIAAANVSIKFGLAEFLMDKVMEMSGGLKMPDMTQIKLSPNQLGRSLSNIVPKLPPLEMDPRKLTRSLSDLYAKVANNGQS